MATSSPNGREHDLYSRLDALRADLEALQHDMKGLAGDVGDAAADRMNVTLNDAMKSVQDMSNRLEGWSNDNLDTVRQSVRNQPLATMAMAMGVGALLGAILFRR